MYSVSVDGRAFVWKIDEGPDDQGKAQISGKIIIALQIESNINPIHPRACWHCHKQVTEIHHFHMDILF